MYINKVLVNFFRYASPLQNERCKSMVKCTVRFILTFTISSVQVTRIKLLAITILCYPKENGNYGTCFTRYVFDSFYTECSTWSIGLYLHFSFPVRTDIILMQQPTHSLYFVFFFFF